MVFFLPHFAVMHEKTLFFFTVLDVLNSSTLMPQHVAQHVFNNQIHNAILNST